MLLYYVILKGNKDLCGAPLAKPCDSSSMQPPLPPSSIDSQSNSLNKALIAVLIIVSIGFVLSLIVICILLPKWRKNHGEEEVQAQFLPPLPSAPSRKHDVEFTGPVEQPRSSAASGGKRARKDEPGKLSFVKEDGQRFELEDLLRASAELLGSGDLWASYKAALFDGPSLVVKKLKEKHGIGRDDFQEHMWRLGRLSHPNLLPIVAYIHKKEEKMIITDYVPNGSLAHMLHSKTINHKIFSNSYIRYCVYFMFNYIKTLLISLISPMLIQDICFFFFFLQCLNSSILVIINNCNSNQTFRPRLKPSSIGLAHKTKNRERGGTWSCLFVRGASDANCCTWPPQNSKRPFNRLF